MVDEPEQPGVPQEELLESYGTQSEGGDSAYSDLASETASVTSSILAGQYETGRRYHAVCLDSSLRRLLAC